MTANDKVRDHHTRPNVEPQMLGLKFVPCRPQHVGGRQASSSICRTGATHDVRALLPGRRPNLSACTPAARDSRCAGEACRIASGGLDDRQDQAPAYPRRRNADRT
jgi:hypothetical protein